MALRATKDTFATELVGGAEVRRRVFAGDPVPDGWTLEEGGEEIPPGTVVVINGGYEPVTGPPPEPETKASKSGKKE